MNRKIACVLAAALVQLCASAASAQMALAVRVDNDAFNFWQAPWDRPDEEYSSGVRLVFDFRGAPWWSFAAGGPAGCGAHDPRCVSHRWTLGQDIYTAARHIGDPTPVPGSRPDAGVLWLQETQRIARSDRLDELAITLGVTGEPALSSAVQRIVHGYAPGWQRPIDWSKQLPFEPVFSVAYDMHGMLHLGGLELQPHYGASLGNLLTEARAGIGARTGWNLAPAFLPPGAARGFSFSFVADAAGRAVARNETLSGTMFRASQHVTLRPLVSELNAGFSVGFGRATASYIVHQTGSEYTAHPGAHQWSALQAEWYFGR